MFGKKIRLSQTYYHFNIMYMQIVILFLFLIQTYQFSFIGLTIIYILRISTLIFQYYSSPSIVTAANPSSNYATDIFMIDYITIITPNFYTF